ncbi:hypothetical protein NZ47_12005 [Anaerovibrio lipolyticus]|uniref:DpnD/PcfM-like C-terminal domain-containing protein n=1 Tax=Anaerovibrio lipolyticus TaxID=82374 RepID=A0A0B2JXM1_9FIRM|nr:DpnD/PcfM family protein [Anaerovibrio lipolyticus]KHM50657.1 hypothetical protein NZ47_12005 [Anaerovibrio lipolyticus]
MAEENVQENKVFLVRVEETLVADVYVEAASYEEAQEKVEEKYHNQELVLDDGNYSSTDYSFPEEYESITKFREYLAGKTVHLINENNELVLTDIKPVRPVIKESQDVSYEKEWDFSQFTEEQYNSYARQFVILAESIAEHNMKHVYSDEKKSYEDITFSIPNNSMFIKYKDLFIIPRIWENTDDEQIEILLDTYIPRKTLLQVDKTVIPINNLINSMPEGFTYFHSADFQKDASDRNIFVEKNNGEFIATECELVDMNTIGFLHGKDINADTLFSYIKDYIAHSNPELVFENIKPYFLASTKLNQHSNIQELTDSGRWNIDMDVYKRIVDGAVFDDAYLGSVAYGNVLYNMHIIQDDTDSGKYYVEFNKSYPSDGTGNLEPKRFFFDTNNFNQLQIDYVIREDDSCAYLTLNDVILHDIEALKKAAAEALAKQQEINPYLYHDYLKMKNSGLNFWDQFNNKINKIEKLDNLRLNELPRDIIYEHSSTVENLDALGDYYNKALPFIFDDNASLQDNNRLLLKEMIDNGLHHTDIVNFSSRLGEKNYYYIMKSFVEPEITEYRKQIIDNICSSSKILSHDIHQLAINYHGMAQGEDHIVRDMIKRGLPDKTINDVFKVIDNIMNSDFNRSSYAAELLKSPDMKQLRKEYAINHNFEDLGR